VSVFVTSAALRGRVVLLMAANTTGHEAAGRSDNHCLVNYWAVTNIAFGAGI
jgi:hypothetical protein